MKTEKANSEFRIIGILVAEALDLLTKCYTNDEPADEMSAGIPFTRRGPRNYAPSGLRSSLRETLMVLLR